MLDNENVSVEGYSNLFASVRSNSDTNTTSHCTELYFLNVGGSVCFVFLLAPTASEFSSLVIFLNSVNKIIFYLFVGG